MKILLVNKYWYTRAGGEVVAMMTRELLEKAGHTTAVFAMQHPKNRVHHKLFPQEIDYRNDSFFTKVKNSMRTLYNGEAKRSFEKMIQEFQPDVVHFHNIYHQLSFSLLEVTKKYNIRSVMTLHDYKLLSPNYSLFHHGHIDTSIVGKKYYRCLLNNCMESVPESIIGTLEAYYRQWKKYEGMIDHYISPSEFLKDLFVQAGWSKKRITVIPNPVEIPKRKIHEKDGAYVAYIGRLSAEKGLSVLLESAALTPDIDYKIVGTGPEEEKLKKIVLTKGYSNVHFEGWRTGIELKKLYEGARVLVVPSIWYENYPLGVLEAKAHGKIVLGSKIGGIPEILKSEFLFSPGDAAHLAQKVKKWYTASLAQRQKAGSILREEVEKINDPHLYVERLEALYHA